MSTPIRYRKYETIFITHPDTTDEEHEELWKRVEGVFSGKGGKEVRREFWGRRRLAYDVNKQRKGVYHYLLYLAQENLVAELERNFRIVDRVMRYMTVRIEDGLDLATFDFEGEGQQMTYLGRRATQSDDSSDIIRPYIDTRSDSDDDDDEGDDDED